MAEDVAGDTVHGTCVAIGGAGVLIRGAPGAGKSDLALRLVEDGAKLVSDDRVRLRRDGDRVLASAPEAIAGLLEVNGVGLVRIEGSRRAGETPLALVCDLAKGTAERLPRPMSETVLGIPVPRLALDPFEVSAPAKLRLAAGRGPGSIMNVP